MKYAVLALMAVVLMGCGKAPDSASVMGSTQSFAESAGLGCVSIQHPFSATLKGTTQSSGLVTAGNTPFDVTKGILSLSQTAEVTQGMIYTGLIAQNGSAQFSMDSSDPQNTVISGVIDMSAYATQLMQNYGLTTGCISALEIQGAPYATQSVFLGTLYVYVSNQRFAVSLN